MKKNRWVDAQYNEIDNFCFNLRDGILNIFENISLEVSKNLSDNEFFELLKLKKLKNKDQVINDSDKNLGAVMADKSDVVKECQRQLYDINTYIRLSREEMEILIEKIKSQLTEIVGRYKEFFLCSTKEKNFCWVKFPNLIFHIFMSYGKF